MPVFDITCMLTGRRNGSVMLETMAERCNGLHGGLSLKSILREGCSVGAHTRLGAGRFLGDAA